MSHYMEAHVKNKEAVDPVYGETIKWIKLRMTQEQQTFPRLCDPCLPHTTPCYYQHLTTAPASSYFIFFNSIDFFAKC